MLLIFQASIQLKLCQSAKYSCAWKTSLEKQLWVQTWLDSPFGRLNTSSLWWAQPRELCKIAGLPHEAGSLPSQGFASSCCMPQRQWLPACCTFAQGWAWSASYRFARRAHSLGRLWSRLSLHLRSRLIDPCLVWQLCARLNHLQIIVRATDCHWWYQKKYQCSTWRWCL